MGFQQLRSSPQVVPSNNDLSAVLIQPSGNQTDPFRFPGRGPNRLGRFEPAYQGVIQAVVSGVVYNQLVALGLTASEVRSDLVTMQSLLALQERDAAGSSCQKVTNPSASLTAKDAVTPLASTVMTPPAVMLRDLVNLVLTGRLSISKSVTLAEIENLVSTGRLTVARALTLVETLGLVLTGRLSIAKSVVLTETDAIAQLGRLAVAKTLTLAEVAALADTGRLVIAEALALAERDAVVGAVGLTIAKSVTLAEKDGTTQTARLTIAEALALTASGTVSEGERQTMAGQATLNLSTVMTPAAALLVAKTIQLSEALAVSESVQRSMGLQLSLQGKGVVVQTVLLSLTKQIQLQMRLSDSETERLTMQGLLGLGNSTTATPAARTVMQLVRSLVVDVDVVDSARMTMTVSEVLSELSNLITFIGGQDYGKQLQLSAKLDVQSAYRLVVEKSLQMSAQEQLTPTTLRTMQEIVALGSRGGLTPTARMVMSMAEILAAQVNLDPRVIGAEYLRQISLTCRADLQESFRLFVNRTLGLQTIENMASSMQMAVSEQLSLGVRDLVTNASRVIMNPMRSLVADAVIQEQAELRIQEAIELLFDAFFNLAVTVGALPVPGPALITKARMRRLEDEAKHRRDIKARKRVEDDDAHE